jgi:hypothetical protein
MTFLCQKIPEILSVRRKIDDFLRLQSENHPRGAGFNAAEKELKKILIFSLDLFVFMA